MNAIRPYEPEQVVTVTTPGYQRGLIPHYPVGKNDQHWRDEDGNKHRTGRGWWWCYHYGTNQYFTIYNPDENGARMTALENGWQFEGAATCKS